MGQALSTRLLSTTRAALFLGVSKQSVQKYIEQGKILAYQYDKRGRLRIPLDTLKEFREASRITPPRQEVAEPKGQRAKGKGKHQ